MQTPACRMSWLLFYCMWGRSFWICQVIQAHMMFCCGWLMCCFAKARSVGRHVMFGESINRTQGQRLCASIASFAMLWLSHKSLYFHWNSPGIPAGPSCSHCLVLIQQSAGGFCWIMPLLLIHVWYPDTTELDCWYPDNGDWNCPQRTPLNGSTNPCSIYHIFLPIFGQ